ncbi:uncharacterized protein NECHADRAFT_88656 [Fusarium vanettenii 77-13-4]|uniref:Uncharacterized protein n=1 Tax=Fusarium vanettenii (strain ATCC MYA-4622 / CBS 123669 / FGSC 9596 / NRRL 45880 / 77-13-4) TaxID=660122 RepID=C7ZBT0_FUSV7|nr:uncharacterized protein NECHADRAFT_88950 [Fusarium vanettenii 77-13-4]XP_003044239.1 uncharacterized protein NECHADRAFT_88656 [Fusarium vanettenii 77-13-4]EEU36765.1 hypothetical protein NECHADRAFT_88950 [Fusarium vanettenii 77-13-4]EEU38526.1 hypothetical protein NECHADRAFT_88656 [Fusarium vanettenii 77-13-4]
MQAGQYAQLLSGQQPVAIRTAPMDALMADAGAYGKCDKNKEALKRLEAILLSRDDGVESHTQALDLIYNWNFARFDGGDQYHAAAGWDKARRRLKAKRLTVSSNWWVAVTRARKDAGISPELDRWVEKIWTLTKTVKDLYQIIRASLAMIFSIWTKSMTLNAVSIPHLHDIDTQLFLSEECARAGRSTTF